MQQDILNNEKEQNPQYAQCRHLPKTSINKKVHKVWFHLYEIKEQPKLIYNERKQICSCLGPGGWELKYEGTFGGDENISRLGWQLQGCIHLSKLTDHTFKMGGFYWTSYILGHQASSVGRASNSRSWGSWVQARFFLFSF